MYSKEDAIRISKTVDREKVFLWKRQLDKIMAIETEFYLYSDEETRASHIECLKKSGWHFEEDQRMMEAFYRNLLNYKDDIFVYSAFFERKVDPVDWAE